MLCKESKIPADFNRAIFIHFVGNKSLLVVEAQQYGLLAVGTQPKTVLVFFFLNLLPLTLIN